MEFRTLGFVVVLLRLSLLGVLVLAAPLLEHLYESARNGGLAWRDAVPPACALIGTIDFLVAIEALARRMGARDERLLRERLLAIFEDVLPRS